MLEYTKIRFMKRKAYYEVFIFYSKNPDELNIPTGVKVGLNHLNENKKGKTISGKHPNYENDMKRIREIKDKTDAIVNHFYDTYNEKPPIKYVEEQFAKPFEIEKKKLDNMLDYYPGFLKYKRDFQSSDKSLQPYNSLKMGLDQFQRVQNYNLSFSNLDLEFYKAFLKFLVTERYDERIKVINEKNKGLNNNTVKKRLSYMTAFLRYCIISHNINLNLEQQKDFMKIAASSLEIKSYTVNNNNLSLNIHEVLEFEKWKGYNKKYKKYKDCIVLQLLTGMRISDTKLVDEFDVEIKEGYITKYSEKTNDMFQVKINSIVKVILEEYSYNFDIKDQKYNTALKKIFKDFFEYYKPIYEKILKKDFNLKKVIFEKKGEKNNKTNPFKYELASSKMGRVSFISQKTSDKNLSMKDIMSQTGHKKLETMKNYMDMSENISQEDLNKLLKARGFNLKVL